MRNQHRLPAAALVALAAALPLLMAPTGSPPPRNTIVCSTACSIPGIQVGQVAIVQKGTQTDRISTISKTLDPDLQFTNVPNGSGQAYTVELVLSMQSVGAGGSAVTYADGSAGARSTTLRDCNLTGQTLLGRMTGGVTVTCTAGGGELEGYTSTFESVPVGSAIGVSWAQQASVASNTSMLTDSFISIVRTK